MEYMGSSKQPLGQRAVSKTPCISRTFWYVSSGPAVSGDWSQGGLQEEPKEAVKRNPTPPLASQVPPPPAFRGSSYAAVRSEPL